MANHACACDGAEFHRGGDIDSVSYRHSDRAAEQRKCRCMTEVFTSSEPRNVLLRTLSERATQRGTSSEAVK